MVLKSKTQSREISLLENYTMEPNSDYVLEASFKNSSCNEMELIFDVVAWVGNPSEDPKMTLVCENTQVGKTTFFTTVNILTAFASAYGKEKFLSPDAYCGEKFDGHSTGCRESGGFSQHESGFQVASTDCRAEKGSKKRSFQVEFNGPEKSAIVSCQANGKETFSGKFEFCEAAISDYKLYN